MRTDWLCLEFTKTVGWEARDRADDQFGSYAAVVDWVREHDVVSVTMVRALKRKAGPSLAEARRVLGRAIALRELIYSLFRAVGDGRVPPAADVDALNKALAAALPRRQIVRHGDRFVWEWRADPVALDRILDPVVWSAAELLTAPERLRVKHCESDGCGWLFIDGSKNRSRRWCDMADCGNLEKVRRFRQKRRRTRSP